jgi:peptidase inhibitor family I36
MKIRTILAAAAVAAAATVGAAAPASANKDGTCHLGDLCYWWGANWRGSTIDYAGFGGANPVANYAQDRFLSPGIGQGSPVANNQEAVANYDPDYWVSVYTGPNFTGAHLTFGPYASGYPWYNGNLPAPFRNNLESHEWGS